MIHIHGLSIFITLNVFGAGLSLSVLSSMKENDIVRTESSIRNTVDELLSSLSTAPEMAPKLERYLRVHNYFLSLSHRDYKNLKEIEKLTRVADNGNVPELFMKTMNEILNDENDAKFEIPIIRDPHKPIDNFIEELNQLTSKYSVAKNVLNVDAKKRVRLEQKLNDILDVKSEIGNQSESSEYWIETSRRIFGSKKTKIKYFPFTAAVQVFGQFYCAGAIIANDMVITAASCLQLAWNNRYFRENFAHVSVRVGSSFPTIGGEVIAVVEIYFNPNYDPSTLQANLAIIRLARHLNFQGKKKSKIKKILFDRNPTQIPFSTAGVTLVGWGAKDEANKLEPRSTIQYHKLDVFSSKECQEIYSKQYVGKENICIGFFTKGGGACNHDVGDPGIVNGLLTGIVSFASPVCGQAEIPTVLTKLGFFAEWIDGILAMEAPTGRARFTEPPPTPPLVIPVPKKKKIKIVPLVNPPIIPYHVSEALLTYFNNDTGLYEAFVRSCNDKDVNYFDRALKGHGLQTTVKTREKNVPESIYLKH